jgi:hypothetical protein
MPAREAERHTQRHVDSQPAQTQDEEPQHARADYPLRPWAPGRRPIAEGRPDVDRPWPRTTSSRPVRRRAQAARSGSHRSPPSRSPREDPRAIVPEEAVTRFTPDLIPETAHGSRLPHPRDRLRPRILPRGARTGSYRSWRTRRQSHPCGLVWRGNISFDVNTAQFMTGLSSSC